LASNANHPKFVDIKCNTADDLWEKLSPTKSLAPPPSRFIFRGQGDHRWPLVPSAFRSAPGKTSPASILFSQEYTVDEQVFTEIHLLKTFAESCDAAGIAIPNDSIRFRRENLDPQNSRFTLRVNEWPNPELFELMALAQHHGVPTRLLDWTRRPYVAAYFASSSAISLSDHWKRGQQLAIWALNIESINLYSNVLIVPVAGSVSPHLSAQAGCFSVQKIRSIYRNQKYTPSGLEDEFASLPNTPLIRFTLPAEESVRLYELCDKAGFSAATIYPSADGAGIAVTESLNLWHCKRKLKG